MPLLSLVRLFWMSPPRTSVWLLSSTTDVSALRLLKLGELIGGGAVGPMSLTSCLTSRATVPDSPMRGVTVRMMPASLYSTVWVMELPVAPPAATGTCWEVTMGTEVETLMTAFLFSLVMMEGLDRTLTLFSTASALSAEMNSLAAKVSTLKPTGTSPPPRLPRPGMIPWDGSEGVALTLLVPTVFWVLEMVNFPLRRAHS